MADVHSPKQRSFNMSRIRSKDTKPELIVRSVVHQMGFRFRLHRDDLAGKPDLVLPRHRKSYSSTAASGTCTVVVTAESNRRQTPNSGSPNEPPAWSEIAVT